MARAPCQRGPRQHGLSSGLLSCLQLCPRPTSNRDLFGRGLLPLPRPHLELATRVPLKQDGGGVFAEFALQEGRWPSSSCARCNREAAIHCSANGNPHTLPSHRGLLAPLARQMFISRALARDGASRRWCSSCSPTSPRGPLSPPPPVACRKSWGGTELGLPLYLDPRYLLHAVRPAADRFHR